MAGYREHITVSSLLGIGYGGVAYWGWGMTPHQGIIAACLTGVSGMLPDLDSESGRPVREITSLTATVASFITLQNVTMNSGPTEMALVWALGIYLLVRYGGTWIIAKMAVHRGMFHSLPALLIASQLAFLFYPTDELKVKCFMAIGIAMGFLSHLILDEVYSVQWNGIAVRLKNSAGSAVKLFSSEWIPNLFTYTVLAAITYFTLQSSNLWHPPEQVEQIQQAVKETILHY
ncbi:MAG: metal-dependent hydrolase [Planctomycetaceae bacterium]